MQEMRPACIIGLCQRQERLWLLECSEGENTGELLLLLTSPSPECLAQGQVHSRHKTNRCAGDGLPPSILNACFALSRWHLVHTHNFSTTHPLQSVIADGPCQLWTGTTGRVYLKPETPWKDEASLLGPREGCPLCLTFFSAQRPVVTMSSLMGYGSRLWRLLPRPGARGVWPGDLVSPWALQEPQ